MAGDGDHLTHADIAMRTAASEATEPRLNAFARKVGQLRIDNPLPRCPDGAAPEQRAAWNKFQRVGGVVPYGQGWNYILRWVNDHRLYAEQTGRRPPCGR